MTKTKLSTRWLAGPLAVALSSMAGVAQAQPNGEGGLGQNPPNQGGGRPDWRNMTPEQRAQFEAQMRERFVREMLIRANFTDKAVQDAVVEFANAQATATQSLQEKARALGEAVMNRDTPDVQVATLLADFRAAVAAEKTRREQSLKDLNTSTSYTTTPRLDALLTLGGLIGDESSVMGGMMGGGRGGRGGPGGFGGPGGRGGRRGGGGGGGGQGGADQ